MSSNKKKKNKKQNKKRNVKYILISLAVFLCLVLAIAGGGYWFLMNKLDMLDYSDGKLAVEELLDDAGGENQDSSGESQNGHEAGEQTEQADLGEAEGEFEAEEETVSTQDFLSDEELESLGISEINLSEENIFFDEDVINILLLGTDERKDNYSTNARADSIMVLSVDKENKALKLVSLERGMGVPILEGQYKGQYDWLTHCFRYGGADLMMKEVQECLRLDVDRYVRVNFNTFAQLIDSIGGVDIALTALEVQGLNGEVRTNARTKHKVYEGLNHLDGYDALQYSRLRYIDSDWKRIERQRNVIQAVVHKAKGLNLLELNEAANTILPLIQTNLTKSEIMELVLFAPNVLGADIEQMSIPKKGTYGGMKGMGGRNLYAVDFDANAKILKEFLYGEDAVE